MLNTQNPKAINPSWPWWKPLLNECPVYQLHSAWSSTLFGYQWALTNEQWRHEARHMVSILFIYFSFLFFFLNGFHFRDEKTGALCWSDLLKVTARKCDLGFRRRCFPLCRPQSPRICTDSAVNAWNLNPILLYIKYFHIYYWQPYGGLSRYHCPQSTHEETRAEKWTHLKSQLSRGEPDLNSCPPATNPLRFLP